MMMNLFRYTSLLAAIRYGFDFVFGLALFFMALLTWLFFIGSCYGQSVNLDILYRFLLWQSVNLDILYRFWRVRCRTILSQTTPTYMQKESLVKLLRDPTWAERVATFAKLL